ncbi:MAG: 23S rRNA (pseudouridine(1915)-N(3))-methyltransferase RlmH [Eubacterium sp.]|nr:23S rRNA (pseudouridine(1915)-N(3))-methyltransferase RlmH [Eubacterium sp.]MCM1305303.1 23S rRNA (pseudouridine(1915)-N(3))-methyltransferase RlmH [Butyrivibrio sp.]MCM1344396.1 23S rRNA (pseudouridine(1915)-N(3))-methyltransferase RlmH [Muribaculaceae bacterium]MCM1411718.1 23S rRNA (pseudouridine(1915)-N(3))-methyltransferase RlmH [Lachnospiraceae bacterium]
MKITIVCVGKIKESFYREAVAEYAKRLSRYCKLEIIEVADEKTPDGAGTSAAEQIKGKEAGRILEKLRDDAFVCTLEIGGKRLSSEEFAGWMERLAVNGTSHIAFVIGGSLGLHGSVRERSDLAVSFSDMTFPHQLMRVILAEQIYRAFCINNGTPYHK